MHEEMLPAEAIAEHVPQSQFHWVVTVLGINGILLPLLGLAAFLVVLALVLRGRGPAMVGAILLVTPLPIYWAVFSAIKAMVSAFAVIALADVALKPSECAEGFAETLLIGMMGLLAAAPAFLLGASGLTVRALTENSPELGHVKIVKLVP